MNADDLGQHPAINAGVSRAHSHGLVTSASLMVRWPWAREAAAWAASQERLSLGLHIDLGEWVPTGREWEWAPRYEVVDPTDRAAVDDEFGRQIDQFLSLVRCRPTHLDSHQHVHLREPALGVARRWAAELDVPLRLDSAVRFEGRFYGQDSGGRSTLDAISCDALIRILCELQSGTTELCCHPGDGTGSGPYMLERGLELAALCDPRVLRLVDELDVELCTFDAIGREPSPA